MSALPSPNIEVLPPLTRFVEAPGFRTTGQEREWFCAGQPPSSRASRRHLARLLTMFLLGAAATLAWQSYGHAARERIARLSPQLQWLAPQAPLAQSAPGGVELISRSVDQIAADMTATQEQMTRSIDQLAARQEQTTREIIRLQAMSLYSSSKNQEPPPQPAHVLARKAVQRSSQMH